MALPSGVTQTGITFTASAIVVTANIGYVAPTSSANISVTVNGLTSNQMSITLNGPSYTTVQSDVIGTTTNNPNGKSRFVTYQVFNLDKTPVGSIPIAESVVATYNCQQPNPGNITASCNAFYSTDSSGLFTDEWGYYTGYTPQGCGVTITDHWQWCAPTGPNPGITFQTLGGFIHTDDSKINGYTNPPSAIPAGTIFGP